MDGSTAQVGRGVEAQAGVTVTQVLQPPPDPFTPPAVRQAVPTGPAASSNWLRGVFSKPRDQEGA